MNADDIRWIRGNPCHGLPPWTVSVSVLPGESPCAELEVLDRALHRDRDEFDKPPLRASERRRGRVTISANFDADKHLMGELARFFTAERCAADPLTASVVLEGTCDLFDPIEPWQEPPHYDLWFLGACFVDKAPILQRVERMPYFARRQLQWRDVPRAVTFRTPSLPSCIKL